MSGEDGGGLSAEERETLADVLGAELYESLMEATADQWRQWRFLTDFAKERYRAEGAKIIAAAVEPAITRIVAARVAAAEQRAERVTAERDRLAATVDALAEKAPEQRLLEAIFGTAGCRCGCGAPRWDEDEVVLTHGWNTPDRCGRCGEVQPAAPAPREYDDGGPRVREAVERAERDAEVKAAAVDFARAGRRATLDPGAFVKRGRDEDGDYERMDQWQERALLAAVAAVLAPDADTTEGSDQP